MVPSGCGVHPVKPKGTLVQTSQNCVDGMLLILTRIPASFHCSTSACTASSSPPDPACRRSRCRYRSGNRRRPGASSPSPRPAGTPAASRTPGGSGLTWWCSPTDPRPRWATWRTALLSVAYRSACRTRLSSKGLTGCVRATHGLGGRDLVQLDVPELLDRIELGDRRPVEPVDLLARDRRDLRGVVVPEVDELQGVEVGSAAPVRFLPRLQHLLPLQLVLHQLERPRPVRPHLELAVLRRVQDQERVVEQPLRHRDLRRLAVELHGEVVAPSGPRSRPRGASTSSGSPCRPSPRSRTRRG